MSTTDELSILNAPEVLEARSPTAASLINICIEELVFLGQIDGDAVIVNAEHDALTDSHALTPDLPGYGIIHVKP